MKYLSYFLVVLVDKNYISYNYISNFWTGKIWICRELTNHGKQWNINSHPSLLVKWSRTNVLKIISIWVYWNSGVVYFHWKSMVFYTCACSRRHICKCLKVSILIINQNYSLSKITPNLWPPKQFINGNLCIK